MAELMIVPDVALLTALHAVNFVFVQLEHVPIKNPLAIDDIMTSDVSVTRKYSSPLRMTELFDDAVVVSNSPFLPSSLTRGRGGAPRKMLVSALIPGGIHDRQWTGTG